MKNFISKFPTKMLVLAREQDRLMETGQRSSRNPNVTGRYKRIWQNTAGVNGFAVLSHAFVDRKDFYSHRSVVSRKKKQPGIRTAFAFDNIQYEDNNKNSTEGVRLDVCSHIMLG